MKLIRVRKRTGYTAKFNLDKLTEGILDSAKSTGGFRRDIELFDNKEWNKIFKYYATLNEREIAQSLALQTKTLLQMMPSKPNEVLHVEKIQDEVENVLYNSGFVDIWESYRLFRWGRTAVRDGRITDDQFRRSGMPDKLRDEILVWNLQHGCNTIQGLNEIVRDENKFKQLIEEGTQEYESQLDKVAQKFLKDPKKVIVFAGPSSSGKTTTTNITAEKMNIMGGSSGSNLTFKPWHVDHYYLGLNHLTPDEYNDYDYETPDALDTELIREHLDMLLEGKTIQVPNYDFIKGKRVGVSSELCLRENDVLVIDNLYALSTAVFRKDHINQFFKVYIETLNTIKSDNGRQVKLTDTRLMRRMSRDSLPKDQGGRGYDVGLTLGHWHYVRNGELRYLIPLWPTADHVVNGSLPFELPLLKAKLDGRLPPLSEFYGQGRHDAFIRGSRLYSLMDELETASDKYVSGDSLVREFIGRKK